MKRQRGAALLVALLVAVLVSVFAIRIANNYTISQRRVENSLYSDQVYFYLLSAESVAKQLLIADDNNIGESSGQDIDFLGEPWAAEYPPVPIGFGIIAPQPIQDLQARFNVNSLAKPAVQGEDAAAAPGFRYSREQKQFIRLLQTFEEDDVDMDVQRARGITAAVIDWVDQGTEPVPFEGAEDSYYADQDVPYRAANTLIRDISELRLIKGMDAPLFAALKPHITALDNNENQININTASENVLRAMGWEADEFQPLSSEAVSQHFSSTDPEVGQTWDEVQKLEPWASLNSDTQQRLDSANMVSSSNYFEFTSRAKMGEITIPMTSVLRASDGEVDVVSRNTSSI